MVDIEAYSVEPPDCIRWKTKCGSYSHYCISVPYKNCPPLNIYGLGGCVLSQFKPVWHRMKNKYYKAKSMELICHIMAEQSKVVV
jgi:hypothetical protein